MKALIVNTGSQLHPETRLKRFQSITKMYRYHFELKFNQLITSESFALLSTQRHCRRVNYPLDEQSLTFCFFLSVPKVEIVDERGLSIPDKFYKAGSTIELKCVISQVPQTSSYVTWKHGTRMLNYDTSRGGIR